MTDGPNTWHPPQIPAPEAVTGYQELLTMLPPSERGALLTTATDTTIPLEVAATHGAQAEAWKLRIEYGEVTPTFMAGMAETLADGEAAYPGAHLWNAIRGDLTCWLEEQGHRAPAHDMLDTIHEPHLAASTAVEIALAGGGERDDILAVTGNGFLAGYVRRLDALPENGRALDFLQGLANHAINEGWHDQPIVDHYEEALTARDPGRDHVQAWADLQRRDFPRGEWDRAAELVKNDPMWEGIPVNQRKFVTRQQMLLGEVLRLDPSLEHTMDLVGLLNDYRGNFPDASAWDTYSYGHARTLIDAGEPLYALHFAYAMCDPAQMRHVTDYLRRAGHDAEAGMLRRVALRNAALQILRQTDD
ncbi:MAG TPA: hypothetical protein VLF71_01420 [Candidatus Saccharimonadales bacterium]|nr:hypothetical protein [Candidatus Saccharimonadales bacterium]